MNDPVIFDAMGLDAVMAWGPLVAALEAGHRWPRATVGDMLLQEGPDSMLNRAAWIPGVGAGMKTVTLFPGNPAGRPPMPSVQGVFVLYDAANGQVRAILDGAALTRWKTAGDSALGARLLARPGAERLVVVGAGVIAREMATALPVVIDTIREIRIWNRTPGKAQTLANELAGDIAGGPVEVSATDDLEAAVRQADIVTCATLTREPVIQGAWLKPGAHVDLIGAFTTGMREADDEAMRRGRLFVDYRDTTIGHIGELTIPMAAGVIGEADVLGDLYDLAAGAPGRTSAEDITLYKNGGGAHLDLMTALHVCERAGAG